MAFDSLLRLLKEADLAKAGTVNKPFRQLDQNVRYIWEVLQAAALGSTVYARAETVEAEAKQGQAVWYNPLTARFERALARLDPDAAGSLLAPESAQVWGIVAKKLNTTLADILLFGRDDVDISAALTGSVTAGTYYLSGTTPGNLSRQRPPVSIAVLRADGAGKVFVMPQFVDALNQHTHYKFELTCWPNGTTRTPAPGERHQLDDDGDSDAPGWLSAHNSVFEGKAPAGALYGYNLKAHPALQNAWPPLPLSSAYLEWNKGLDQDVGATGVPLGRTGLVVLDANGIWWLSDCYGDVPWPVTTETVVSAGSDSYSDSTSAECARHIDMRLTLYFTKPQFATDDAVVTSLRSGDSRIKVRCTGTDIARTAGDLELTLDLDLTTTDEATGHLALKEFNKSTSAFKRGPIVEGVYATGSNVTLSGSAKRRLTPGDNNSPWLYQGAVKVDVSTQPTQELNVALVRLDGATEEHYQDLMYVNFPAGEDTSFRATLHVPADSGLSNPVLKLRFRLLGRAAGTLPQLTFTGRRVARPSAGLDTPVALPLTTAEFTIVCDTTGVLSAANQYVEATSDAFTVAAGDIVFFTVQRAADDGYNGDIGVLAQVGVLSSGG